MRNLMIIFLSFLSFASWGDDSYINCIDSRKIASGFERMITSFLDVNTLISQNECSGISSTQEFYDEKYQCTTEQHRFPKIGSPDFAKKMRLTCACYLKDAKYLNNLKADSDPCSPEFKKVTKEVINKSSDKAVQFLTNNMVRSSICKMYNSVGGPRQVLSYFNKNLAPTKSCDIKNNIKVSAKKFMNANGERLKISALSDKLSCAENSPFLTNISNALINSTKNNSARACELYDSKPDSIKLVKGDRSTLFCVSQREISLYSSIPEISFLKLGKDPFVLLKEKSKQLNKLADSYFNTSKIKLDQVNQKINELEDKFERIPPMRRGQSAKLIQDEIDKQNKLKDEILNSSIRGKGGEDLASQLDSIYTELSFPFLNVGDTDDVSQSNFYLNQLRQFKEQKDEPSFSLKDLKKFISIVDHLTENLANLQGLTDENRSEKLRRYFDNEKKFQQNESLLDPIDLCQKYSDSIVNEMCMGDKFKYDDGFTKTIALTTSKLSDVDIAENAQLFCAIGSAVNEEQSLESYTNEIDANFGNWGLDRLSNNYSKLSLDRSSIGKEVVKELSSYCGEFYSWKSTNCSNDEEEASCRNRFNAEALNGRTKFKVERSGISDFLKSLSVISDVAQDLKNEKSGTSMSEATVAAKNNGAETNPLNGAIYVNQFEGQGKIQELELHSANQVESVKVITTPSSIPSSLSSVSSEDNKNKTETADSSIGTVNSNQNNNSGDASLSSGDSSYASNNAYNKKRSNYFVPGAAAGSSSSSSTDVDKTVADDKEKNKKVSSLDEKISTLETKIKNLTDVQNQFQGSATSAQTDPSKLLAQAQADLEKVTSERDALLAEDSAPKKKTKKKKKIAPVETDDNLSDDVAQSAVSAQPKKVQTQVAGTVPQNNPNDPNNLQSPSSTAANGNPGQSSFGSANGNGTVASTSVDQSSRSNVSRGLSNSSAQNGNDQNNKVQQSQNAKESEPVVREVVVDNKRYPLALISEGEPIREKEKSMREMAENFTSKEQFLDWVKSENNLPYSTDSFVMTDGKKNILVKIDIQNANGQISVKPQFTDIGAAVAQAATTSNTSAPARSPASSNESHLQKLNDELGKLKVE